MIVYLINFVDNLAIGIFLKALLVVKTSSANAGDLRDLDLIPGWRKPPGGGNGSSLQYSCLENPMDRGA